jgi:hypothetical protein
MSALTGRFLNQGLLSVRLAGSREETPSRAIGTESTGDREIPARLTERSKREIASVEMVFEFFLASCENFLYGLCSCAGESSRSDGSRLRGSIQYA